MATVLKTVEEKVSVSQILLASIILVLSSMTKLSRRQTCTQWTWIQRPLASPSESLVVAGRASSQNCSHAPVIVLPILVGTSDPLNKEVDDVNLGCFILVLILWVFPSVLWYCWYKLGIMVFNCLHCQVPSYLVQLCRPVADVALRQHLRSTTRQLLVVRRYQLSTYGRRSFSVAGPLVWNSLP